jgi:hypothetical protein
MHTLLTRLRSLRTLRWALSSAKARSTATRAEIFASRRAIAVKLRVRSVRSLRMRPEMRRKAGAMAASDFARDCRVGAWLLATGAAAVAGAARGANTAGALENAAAAAGEAYLAMSFCTRGLPAVLLGASYTGSRWWASNT